MSNNESQKVRFFPVYNEDMVKVGEVKHDPLRKEKQWTALGAEGYRIMDVDSRLRPKKRSRTSTCSDLNANGFIPWTRWWIPS